MLINTDNIKILELLPPVKEDSQQDTFSLFIDSEEYGFDTVEDIENITIIGKDDEAVEWYLEDICEKYINN